LPFYPPQHLIRAAGAAVARAMVTPGELEAKLRDALQAEYVQATDLSDGCGAKYHLIVVSSAFEGKQ